MSDERDPRLLSGAYALNALTPEERRAVEEAVRDSEELRDEVAGLVDTAVVLALSATPEPPPPGLRARLLAAIEDLPQESPSEAGEVQVHRPDGSHLAPRRRRRRPVRVAGVVLASLGVAALLFGGGVLTQWAVQQPQTAYSQVQSASDVQRATADVRGGGTAEIVWSASEGRTAVALNGVPVPSGRVLQLWTIRADRSITSRGLYMPAGDTAYVLLQGVPNPGQRFAVSVEPPGGSRQPTTTPLAIVPLGA